MNPWFWILVAPLAWSLAHCLRAFAREPEWRTVPMAAVLVALAAVQWRAIPASAGFDLAQLTLDGQLAPLAGWFGLNLLAALAVWVGVQNCVERNRAETRRWHDLEALEGLSRYAVSGSKDMEAALWEVLSLGCAQLECEIGIVTRVDGNNWEIRALYGPLEFQVGDRLSLEATPCQKTLAEGIPTLLSHADAAPPGNPLSFARYIGIPVLLGGQPEGTVCFARRNAPGAPFSMAQVHSAALIAEIVTARLANAPPEHSAAREHPVVGVAPQPEPRETTGGLPGRLRIDSIIRGREARLREILGPGVLLQLQLDDEEAEVEMDAGAVEAIVDALVFHAARLEGESEEGARFMLETSRIEGDPDPYNAASFVTVSVHAPGFEPSASEFARYFEQPSPESHGFAPLSRIRRMLKQRGGDLSGQTAAGIGVTLTAFLPIKDEKDDVRALLLPPLA